MRLPWVRRKRFQAVLEMLGQANGALADIRMLVTSCVGQKDEKTKEIAEAVLERILCSSSAIVNRPAWCVHEFEQALFDRYEQGGLAACAHPDTPAREHAIMLQKAAALTSDDFNSRELRNIVRKAGK